MNMSRIEKLRQTRTLSKKQQSVTLKLLDRCFDDFIVIRKSDMSPKIAEIDEIEELSLNDEPQTTPRVKALPKLPSRRFSGSKSPETFSNPVLSLLIGDSIPRTLKPAEPTVSDMIPINKLAITKKSEPPIVLKKALTIRDYNKLSVNLKFKICLNCIRNSIFKSLEPLEKLPLGSENLEQLNDITNIKNVLFYQIFKRFEKYYSVKNDLLGYLNIPLEKKLWVIESVEKVYLNTWNLGDQTALENALFKNLY